MRQTITSMLGTLPPQFFRVVISTEAENLAQLMYSVLMSGYMFANAWTRLSLTQVGGRAGGRWRSPLCCSTPADRRPRLATARQGPPSAAPAWDPLRQATPCVRLLRSGVEGVRRCSGAPTDRSAEQPFTPHCPASQSMAEVPVRGLLEPELASLHGTRVGPDGALAAAAAAAPAAAASGGSLDDPAYAPGTQKVRVEGEVLRWHHEHGKEAIPALAYIEQLEAEIAELRQQVRREGRHCGRARRAGWAPAAPPAGRRCAQACSRGRQADAADGLARSLGRLQGARPRRPDRSSAPRAGGRRTLRARRAAAQPVVRHYASCLPRHALPCLHGPCLLHALPPPTASRAPARPA